MHVNCAEVIIMLLQEPKNILDWVVERHNSLNCKNG